MKAFNFLLTFTVLFFGTNCIGTSQEDQISVSSADHYVPTVFPKDTTDLWISTGSETSDTVLIVGEGGPKYNLDFEANGRVYWEYLPNRSNYLFVVINQASTYNKTILPSKDFDLEAAKVETENTSEMMLRAINYYKERGKYVVVFGHSYSAWVINHYLATKPSKADKYIITGGRLDADSLQTAYQIRNINTGFEKDGKTLIIPDESEPRNVNRTERYWQIRKNKQLLKFAIGSTRYTKALKDADLSNVIFYYGKYDENIGALSQAEIAFLNEKGAKVFEQETDHYNIWKRVIDDFRDNKIKL